MVKSGVVLFESLGQPLRAAELVPARVLEASALMGRPFELIPSRGSAFEAAGDLGWLNLIGPPTPKTFARARAWLAGLTPSPPRAGLIVTFDQKPGPEWSRILSGRELAAVVADPGAPPSDHGLIWVGFMPELEEAMGRRGAGGPKAYVDSAGALRLAKLFSRRLLDPAWRPASPVRRPLEAMIEIVRACNLRCPMCPAGNGRADLYPPLPLTLFEDIVAALVATVWKALLYNYGEPLLHPHLLAIVGAAKARGLERVEIATNGTLMTSALAAGLVSSGLDFLRFSIDGATQESYAKYRLGGDVEVVWRNLEAVRQAREAAGAEKPVLEAQCVVSRYNETEMDLFRRLALKAGADQVRFKTFNALMSGPGRADEGRRFLPRDEALSRYRDYGELAVEESFRLADCHWPWERVVINADGSIVPCCYDFNGRHRLGRFEGGVEEWWSTEARERFRERLRADPRAIDLCARCPSGVPDLSVRE